MGELGTATNTSPDTVRLYGRSRPTGEVPSWELTADEVWQIARHPLFADLCDSIRRGERERIAADLGSGDLQRMGRALTQLGSPDAQRVAAVLGSWGRYLAGRIAA